MSNSVRLLVKDVRISYPHLFVARAAAQNAQPKFSGSLVVPKDHEMFTAGLLNAAFAEVVAATWPAGAPAGMSMPWFDGDTDPKLIDPSKAPNIFVGAYKFQCNSTTRPTVIDEHKVEVIDPSKVYPGCYVNASISLYAFVNKPGNGVTFGLDGIMFARDGERLDGRPTTDQMFEGIAGAPAATAVVPGGAVPAAMPTAGVPAAGPAGVPPGAPGSNGGGVPQ